MSPKRFLSSLLSQWSESGISAILSPSRFAAYSNNGMTIGLARNRKTCEEGPEMNSDSLASSLLEWCLQSRMATLLSAIICLPLLLVPRRGRPVRRKSIQELHPLAYLDALRGYLALIIFTGHTMTRIWGWIPKSVLVIPWFQFFFRGGFASLNMFFWISGYAVTYRIVGFMHTRQASQLLDALASSIFRRYIRLFLPILPVTLVTALMVRTGIAIPPPPRANVVTGNVISWWVMDSVHLLNPFTHVKNHWDGGSGSKLIDPFWSLSAEFRSSMMMFLFCAGTTRLSSDNRQRLLLLCVLPFMYWEAYWAAMACMGMLFAERRQQDRRRVQTQHPGLNIQIKRDDDHLSPPPLTSQTKIDEQQSGTQALTQTRTQLSPMARSGLPLFELGDSSHIIINRKRLREVLLYLLFAYSFVVLKDPYETDKKRLFPHNLLNKIVPKHWAVQSRMHMHLCIGAIMMLYPLDQLYSLQRPLLQPFSQYLGELSFGIYAMHFPVRWIVWESRYVKWMVAWHGQDAFNHFWIAFPGYMMMTICVLWAADLFRRVDMQVVRLCKSLEDRLFEK